MDCVRVRSTRPAAGRRLRRVAAGTALAACLFLAASARPACADTCSDCAEPSTEALAAAAGATVWDWVVGDVYLFFDAGECRYTVTNAQKKMNGVVILWEGDGMAWNCPFGSADSEVKVELGESSQFAWTVSMSGGLKLSQKALGEITAGFGRSDEMTHVRTLLASITSPIKAALGHKLHWHGYFLAGKFSASAEVGVERRYAWWSKATAYTSTILKKGDLWIACGNGGVAANRIEALSVSIALERYSCTDRGCENPEFLGWFPPPPDKFPKPTPFPPKDPRTLPPDPRPGDAPDDDGPGSLVPPTPAAPTTPRDPPEPPPEIVPPEPDAPSDPPADGAPAGYGCAP